MFFRDRNSISFSLIAVLGMISIPKDTLWAKMTAGPPAINLCSRRKEVVVEGKNAKLFYLLRALSGSST